MQQEYGGDTEVMLAYTQAVRHFRCQRFIIYVRPRRSREFSFVWCRHQVGPYYRVWSDVGAKTDTRRN